MKTAFQKTGLWILLSVLLLNGAAYAGVSGHWSAAAAHACEDYGIADADDILSNPDAMITRAAFCRMVNRAFHFTDTEGAILYSDADYTGTYGDDLKIASAMGYLSGYGATAGPDDGLTREQAFVMLARIYTLTDDDEAATGFADDEEISDWARGSLHAMADAGYVSGMGDGTVCPQKRLTKAEAAQLLLNLLGTVADADTGGVFQNLTIRKPGVTIRNASVAGDLLITDGVGTGDLLLENVTALGRVLISGGGPASVNAENCRFGTLMVQGRRNTHVKLSDDTEVNRLELNTSASVTYGGTSIQYNAATGMITLGGVIDRAAFYDDGTAAVTIGGVTCGVNPPESGIAEFKLLDDAVVRELTLHAPTKVSGFGKTERLNILSGDVVIENTVTDGSPSDPVDTSAVSARSGKSSGGGGSSGSSGSGSGGSGGSSGGSGGSGGSSGGSGGSSGSGGGTIGESTSVPDAPQSLVATPGDGSIALSWSAPANDGGSAVTGYEVSSDALGNWIASPLLSYTFTGLQGGVSYTFQVRAVNAVGSGAAATVTAAPLNPNLYKVTFDTMSGGGMISAETNGTLIVSGDSVREGSEVRFTATPNTGFHVGEWMCDTVPVTGSTVETYTLQSLTADTDVTVTFAYTVTVALMPGQNGYGSFGGSETTITRNAGDEITKDDLDKLALPQKNTGYLFSAWYTTDTPNDPGTWCKASFPVQAPTTLYAVFNGTGATAATPIEIFTVDGLRAMQDKLGLHYRLIDDIILTGRVDGIPIGTEQRNAFTGSFDGGGHTITGLTITGGSGIQGLFGYISGGSVENLGLHDVHIVATGDGVGSVAGVLADNAYIKNCYATGSVTGGTFVGGLVGNISDSSSILDCYVTCEVIGNDGVGGVVGYRWLEGNVENCVALNSLIQAGSSPGRIAGNFRGTMGNNYAREGMKVRGGDVSPSLTGKDGADVKQDKLVDKSWWSTSPLSWDFDGPSSIWQWITSYPPCLRQLYYAH